MAKHLMRKTSEHCTVVAINIDGGSEKHTAPEPI